MPRRKFDKQTVYTVVFYDKGGDVVCWETRRGYGPEDIGLQVRNNLPHGAVRYEAFDEQMEVRQMAHDINVSLRTLLKQHGVSPGHQL